MLVFLPQSGQLLLLAVLRTQGPLPPAPFGLSSEPVDPRSYLLPLTSQVAHPSSTPECRTGNICISAGNFRSDWFLECFLALKSTRFIPE